MRVARSVLPVALVLAAVVCMSVAATADVVSGVESQGNKHVSRDRILLGFGIRAGDELKPESVREGIRRLYEMGHFSDISVEAEPTGEGSVRLIVIVEERPKVASIDITGSDRVSESDIESVLRMEVGAPYEASRLEDSRVAVLELYERKGFPYAKITTNIDDAPGNRINVEFEIEEQLRVVVKEIRFEGNELLDASFLQDVMETREDRWWRTDAFFDRGILDDDLTRITERYREAGFIDAVTEGYETEYDESGERVILTITVDEGGLYTIAGIEWTGASGFAIEALDELTTIAVGDVYEPPKADATIRSAYDWYGERGYIHAHIFKVEDIEDGNHLRLKFHVEEANPAHIGQIHIVGNERTKEKVIRRELVVHPGDLYQTSEIIASQRKIANLGFFDGPWVEFTDSSNPDDIDLVFTVEERQTGRAGVGVSHTSERGITGFIELTEGNLFGNGHYMDLKWEFGKKNSEVVLGFTEPRFMNSRLSVGFDVFDTNDKRNYPGLPMSFYEETFPDDAEEIAECDECPREHFIERERRGGDVRVGLPFMGSRHTMIYTKYTLEQFKQNEYTRIGHDTNADGTMDSTAVYYPADANRGWEWRSGLTATLVRRTTDRRFHPRLGSYTRFSVDLFGWALGGDVEYQRYILDVRKYVPAVWRMTLMLRGRGGLVTGYGDPRTVPNDTRFELGGVGLNGIRGYANRSILPVGKDLYGGRTMLLGTAELKFPITGERSQLPLHGLFFVDGGNTWDSRDDTDPSDLYWGAGAGVRVEVPVLGNLGVDFGYGFDDVRGRDWIVHYQFGLDF